jgi:hypothetical protein
VAARSHPRFARPSGPAEVTTGENAVSLSIPATGFSEVARLVTAGFLSQLAFGFEAVDDLQLAIELALHAIPVEGAHATVGFASDAQGLTVTIGAFGARSLERHLREGVGEGPELERVLARLVDSVEVAADRPGTLVLRKRLEAAPA